MSACRSGRNGRKANTRREGSLTGLDRRRRHINHKDVAWRGRASDLSNCEEKRGQIIARQRRERDPTSPLGLSSSLARAHQVLARRHKIHHAMVQLCPFPPIRRLVGLRVPVKALRHLVREVAHRTLPPVATLDEGHEGVDVGSTPTASSDDEVADNGDFGLEERKRDDRKSDLIRS